MTLQERTPVPILQNEWEFEKLLSIYNELQPKKIIEIGSFFGGTLYHWLKSFPTSITCVDLPIPKEDGRHEQMMKSRELWKTWVEGYEYFDPVSNQFKPVVINDIKGDSTSTEVINEVHDINLDKVDFLFIDGDHSYKGVKADYENYQDLVRPGGLIVFHDVIGYNSVNQLWNEVKKGKKYTEICAGGPDGWGIGVIEK